ncbi:MAG TPA: hypothetical protein VMV31_09000, partial [Terriglobales bacterium]|nr:hypothetical protein [Terriglobales bacterium]HVA64304.1 hypothetical protein [Terriglobales bacterium]
SGFGVANRDLARRLQDLDFGDFNPTPSDIAAVNASCAQIAQAAAQLQQIDGAARTSLDTQLAAAHLAPLPAFTLPAPPYCSQ